MVETHVQNLCYIQTNHGIGHFYKMQTYATPWIHLHFLEGPQKDQ